MLHAAATHTLPKAHVERFRQFLADRLGWSFPAHREPDLLRALAGLADVLHLPSLTDCVNHLAGGSWDQRQVESIASYLTVGETHFCRHWHDFEALRDHVLPERYAQCSREGRGLRLWSAGCSSGEEPYTLAALLDQHLPQTMNRLRILATDINPRSLAKAREAEYTEWSFRETSAAFRRQYFNDQGDGRQRLIPRIQRHVHFDFLNLADRTYPSPATDTGGMDLILCRNVLIYFTKEHIVAVLTRLRQALAPGGVLLVSPCESALVPRDLFRATRFGGTFVFRDVREAQPTEPPRPRTHAQRRQRKPRQQADCSQEGRKLYQEGRYEAAAGLLSAAAKTAPSTASVADSVRALANSGCLAEAIAACDHALRDAPFDTGLHYLKGTVCQEASNPDLARESLRRVLYLDPTHILAHVLLTNLMRESGRASEAERHLHAAMMLLDAKASSDPVAGADGLTVGQIRHALMTIANQPPQLDHPP